MHSSNSIIKFADDTTVVGLITNNDEAAYWEEVRALGVWCQVNNLSLNVNKTKEMIVDFRKQQREHVPIHIDGTVVEKVESFKFLSVHITDELKWSTHTDSVVKKEQQRTFNLRRLKKPQEAEGTTRNSFEGMKVVQLEYEAYIPMAESELRKIYTDIRARWPTVRHICVHHRLGVVPVTEASVIIGISSPHRRDSLEAVQYCIDTLKGTVPIWKKEVYEADESRWKENKECQWT
uniref:Molybdenum cofactor synthesis 2 n=1 Tax=Salmo trutta TaxID=8032 RepID=A0A673Y9S4_SALTR